MKKQLLMVSLVSLSLSCFAWKQDGIEVTEDTYSCTGNTVCTFRADAGCATLAEKKKTATPRSADVQASTHDAYTYPEQNAYVKSEHELYVESLTEHRPLPISFKFELESHNVRANQGRSCVLPDQNELRVHQVLDIWPQALKAGKYPIVATTTVQGALYSSVKQTKTLHVSP